MARMENLVLIVLVAVCLTAIYAAPQFGGGFAQSSAQAQSRAGDGGYQNPYPLQFGNRPGFGGPHFSAPGYGRPGYGRPGFGPPGYGGPGFGHGGPGFGHGGPGFGHGGPGFGQGGYNPGFARQGGTISISKSISISRGGPGGAASSSSNAESIARG